jgi:hypothetical protein
MLPAPRMTLTGLDSDFLVVIFKRLVALNVVYNRQVSYQPMSEEHFMSSSDAWHKRTMRGEHGAFASSAVTLREIVGGQSWLRQQTDLLGTIVR